MPIYTFRCADQFCSFKDLIIADNKEEGFERAAMIHHEGKIDKEYCDHPVLETDTDPTTKKMEDHECQCPNCGEAAENLFICLGEGCGEIYCLSCGVRTDSGVTICSHCGIKNCLEIPVFDSKPVVTTEAIASLEKLRLAYGL